MLIIGLTGGIGSGKTAATDHFKSLGIEIVDADVVARQVVEPQTTALSKIKERFGDQILTDAGELNRAALRTIIFDSKKEKDWLETLLHPLIRQEIINQLNASNSQYTILVSPLLFETDQARLVDKTLLIDVPEELQIERASARDNNSAEQIKKILASQSPRSYKIQRADDIIVNDGSLKELHKKVEQQHQYYLKNVEISLKAQQ